jgi:hypothetical protein
MRSWSAGLFGAACLGLAACSQGQEKAVEGSPGPAAATAPGDRFYDRQAFTIRYRLDGAQTGTRAEYVRDWGRLRATEDDTVMQIMGMAQPVRQRQVIEGPMIYTVDLTTNAVTAMENPIYSALITEMRGQDPVAFGKAMMRRMGGTETDETGRFAGHDCTYWTLLGGRTCVSDWGGVLHTETGVAGFQIVQTATEVRLGDGGPDSAFVVDKAAARRVEAPEMDMQDVEQAARAGEEALENLRRMAPSN